MNPPGTATGSTRAPGSSSFHASTSAGQINKAASGELSHDEWEQRYAAYQMQTAAPGGPARPHTGIVGSSSTSTRVPQTYPQSTHYNPGTQSSVVIPTSAGGGDGFGPGPVASTRTMEGHSYSSPNISSSSTMPNNNAPTGSTRKFGGFSSSKGFMNTSSNGLSSSPLATGSTAYPQASVDNRSQQAYDNNIIPGIGGNPNKSHGVTKGGFNSPFYPHVNNMVIEGTNRGVSEKVADEKRVQLVRFSLKEDDGGQLIAMSIRKRLKFPDDVVVINTLSLLDDMMRTCPFFYRYVANDLFFRRMWRFVNPNYKDGVKGLFKTKSQSMTLYPATSGEDLKGEIMTRVLVLLRAWAEELLRMYKGKFEPAAAFIVERYNNKKSKVRFPSVPPTDTPWICPPGGVDEASKRRRANASNVGATDKEEEDILLRDTSLIELEAMVSLIESILDNATDVKKDLKDNDICVDLVKRLRIFCKRMDEFVASKASEKDLTKALDTSDRASRALRDYDNSVLIETVVREAGAPVVDFDEDGSSNHSAPADLGEYGPVPLPEYAGYGPPVDDMALPPPLGYSHSAPPPLGPPPPADRGYEAQGPPPPTSSAPIPLAEPGHKAPEDQIRKKTSSGRKKKASRKKHASSEGSSEESTQSEPSERDSDDDRRGDGSSEESDSEEERRKARRRKAKARAARRHGKSKKDEGATSSIQKKAEENQISSELLAAHLASLSMSRPPQPGMLTDPYSAALLAMYASQMNANAYSQVNPAAYRTVNPAMYQTVQPQSQPQPQISTNPYSTANSAAAAAAAMAAYQSMRAYPPAPNYAAPVPTAGGYYSMSPSVNPGFVPPQQAPSPAPVQMQPQYMAPPSADNQEPKPPPVPQASSFAPPPEPINPGASPVIDPAAALAAYHSFLTMYSSSMPPPPPIGVAPLQASQPASSQASQPAPPAAPAPPAPDASPSTAAPPPPVIPKEEQS